MAQQIDYGADESGKPLRPVFTNGRAACFDMGGEYFVYRDDHLIRVCPSVGMAREVAAGVA